LFIISSTEALPVAEEIQSGLQYHVFPRLWTDGVFFAGGYSLEALEIAVNESEFAVAVAQADDIVKVRGRSTRRFGTMCCSNLDCLWGS
jgi:CRP/FNR family transcriptional regulator, cyclic AMP receptor protein